MHLHPTWQHRIGDWFRAVFSSGPLLIAIVCLSASGHRGFPDQNGGRGSDALLNELDRIRYGNVLDAYSAGVFGVGVDRSEESKKNAPAFS